MRRDGSTGDLFGGPRIVVEEVNNTEGDATDVVWRDAGSPLHEEMLEIRMAVEGKVECHGADTFAMMGARKRVVVGRPGTKFAL